MQWVEDDVILYQTPHSKRDLWHVLSPGEVQGQRGDALILNPAPWEAGLSRARTLFQRRPPPHAQGPSSHFNSEATHFIFEGLAVN